MSVPQMPKPAKLVVGLFLGEKGLIAPAARDLLDAFGPMDMISSWFGFDFTSYYEREMGRPLFRRLFSFQELIGQDRLPTIKRATNDMEDRYRKNGRRQVNIDPGYMVHSRFVLATGKDYAHRIYMGDGIYADLTLTYQQGRFRTLPWTYPDYAAKEMRDYLSRIRNKYVDDLKRGPQSDAG